MYAGLTIADKDALDAAKARGAEWVARDDDDGVVWSYADRPHRLDGDKVWDGDAPIQAGVNIACKADEPVNIDLALAQIAEMERETSGCDLCNGKSDEHGFFIDGNVLFYRDGQLGTEGIVINTCPMCGKNRTSLKKCGTDGIVTAFTGKTRS